jgi:hypothetical protein
VILAGFYPAVSNNLKSEQSTVFFHGKEASLCKRSIYFNEQFLKTNNISRIQIEYDVDDQAICTGVDSIYANSQSQNVPVDWGDFPAVNLSSIDVGELWILLRLLSQKVFQGIDFFYLVPDSYGEADIGKNVLRKEVSKSGGAWRGLPGLVTGWNIDDGDFRQFSFLGFDVHRLGSIDSYEGFPDNLNRTYIIADPPTASYWIERSLRDNHGLIIDVLQDRKSITPIERMAGMCPATINSQLRNIRSKISKKQRWCLLPLGPKIQTLGAILFTSNQLEIDNKVNNEPTVGILYDFPKPNKEMAKIEKKPNFFWKFSIRVL